MSVQHIVVGVTDSETSQRAARVAADYAAAWGATLHFVTAVRREQHEVVELAGDRWELSSLDDAEAKVTGFVRSLALTVEHTVVAREGDPAEVLVDEAERLNAELVVVGNVRMRGASRVLGSVGSQVLRTAPGDVLVVKTV